MGFELRSARYLAADALRQAVRPGDRVIDATMGNGHDTCMLAELVGPAGRVWAFDVQPAALSHTDAALRQLGLRERCELILDGHEHLRAWVAEPVRAAVFNLGWLPGGDKSVTTRWETTRQAVEDALALLEPGGVVSICVYPGHEAGDRERQELTAWLGGLRPQAYNVLHQRFLNAGPGAPEHLLIQRQQPLT